MGLGDSWDRRRSRWNHREQMGAKGQQGARAGSWERRRAVGSVGGGWNRKGGSRERRWWLGPEGAGRTAGDVGTAEGRIWDRKRAVGPPEQPRARVRRQFQARLRNFCKKGLTSARIDGIIPLAVSKSRLRYTVFRCASGGIGRLAGFRCQCSLRACGFDSRLAHQTSGRKSGGFSFAFLGLAV